MTPLHHEGPQGADPARRPRWHLVYYGLALFDLLTVALTLVLSHSLAGSFSDSVQVDREWASRLDRYIELGSLAGQANAPGNDVFESLDVAAESARMHERVEDFEELERSLRQDVLEHVPGAHRAVLLDDLDTAQRAMHAMASEGETIFRHVAEGRLDLAGERMAAMDGHYATITAAVRDMTKTVGDIQAQHFEQHFAAVRSMQRREYLVLVMILLIIAGVTVYGHKLARKMAEDERLKAEYLCALYGAEAQYRAVLQGAADGVVVVGPDGRIRTVNRAAVGLLGVPEERLLGSALEDLIPGWDVPAAREGSTLARLRHSDDQEQVELELTVSDVAVSGLQLKAVLCRDVTGRIRHEQELQRATAEATRAREAVEALVRRVAESEERFALAMAGSNDGLWDWDLRTDHVHYSPRWAELLGIDPEQLRNTPAEWHERIAPGDLARFEQHFEDSLSGRRPRFDVQVAMRHVDGSMRTMLCRGAAVLDSRGLPMRIAGCITDITELERAQQELRALALTDALTGLDNRAVFIHHVQKALARRRRDAGQFFAVLFFDFDRFKLVNDSLGHDVGDLLLQSIADRFREALREQDTVARFGGDEFAVLLTGLRSPAEAEEICQRLLCTFAQPHELAGHQVTSTASIGLVTCELGHPDVETLLRDADAAMYRAKSLGKNRYCLFDATMHSEAIRELQTEQDLRLAIGQGQLALNYQPVVHLESGQVRGFESLVRWDHPTRGRIPPDQFLPVAEETGLIIELGAWVMREVCRQLAEWRAEFGPRPEFVTVNISRRQLVHPDLIAMLVDAVEAHGLVPADVKLEVTETVVMDERHDMVPTLEALRARGFALAIDDFGTGYSALSCLHDFPVDVLKIDKSFTSDMENRREYTAVVHAIVTLAHHLDLSVVVEGVENEAQLSQLQLMDCEYGQGYLFWKPLSPAEAGEVLRGDARARAA